MDGGDGDGDDDVRLQNRKDGKMVAALYVCMTPSDRQDLSLCSVYVQSVGWK